MLRLSLLLITSFLFVSNSFSQFDRKQARKIKMADDSCRNVVPEFIMHERIHYGLLVGYHQGMRPELEIGLQNEPDSEWRQGNCDILPS
ncbi:MAG TPA: hypothetical protein VGC65_09050 [Bacteroidia bacterium]|jgi:hypothetical protein